MIFVVERLSDFFSFPPSLRLYDFLWRLLDFIVKWLHDLLSKGCVIFLLRGCMIFVEGLRDFVCGEVAWFCVWRGCVIFLAHSGFMIYFCGGLMIFFANIYSKQ